MLSTWQRYLLRECFFYFFAALASLSLIMASNSLIRMGSSTLEKGISLMSLAQLTLLSLPSTAFITIPVSALIATMALSSALNRSNEMVILYSAGISPFGIMKVILFASTVITGIAIANSFVLAPLASKQIQHVYADMAENVSYRVILPGVFNKLGDTTLFYYHLGREGFHDVMVAQGDLVLSARSGSLVQGDESMVLLLRDGTIVDARQGQSFTRFAVHEIPLETAVDSLRLSYSMMSVEQLRQLKGSKAILEIHKRYALSVSTLLFGVLGFMLGARGGRSGKGASVLTSLMVVLAFYLIRAIGVHSMDAGLIAPQQVEWIGPGVMAAVTVFVYFRFRRNIL